MVQPQGQQWPVPEGVGAQPQGQQWPVQPHGQQVPQAAEQGY